MQIGKLGKILLLLIFCLVIIVAIIFTLNYFNSSDNKKQACFNRMDQLNGPELIDFLKEDQNIIDLNSRFKFYDNRRYHSISLAVTKYYICKIRSVENKEEYYHQGIDFLKNVNAYSWEDFYGQSLTESFKKQGNDLRLAIAYGNMDDLCPDNLSGICMTGVFGSSTKANDLCNELCSYIINAENDSQFFEEGVVKLSWIKGYNKDDNTIYDKVNLAKIPSSIGWWRIALAFRIGGEDAAHRLCEDINDVYNRNLCIKDVEESLNFIKNKSEVCDIYLDRIKSDICYIN